MYFEKKNILMNNLCMHTCLWIKTFHEMFLWIHTHTHTHIYIYRYIYIYKFNNEWMNNNYNDNNNNNNNKAIFTSTGEQSRWNNN